MGDLTRFAAPSGLLLDETRELGNAAAVKPISCPQCRQPIPAVDVNVAGDVAYCRRCNAASSLAEFVHTEQVDVDLQRPPPGTWQRPSLWGNIYGASHRSWGAALATLGICLFWNGIVSVFVAVALSGTMHHLGFTPPSWFPAPEMNGGTMGRGMVVFLWLFLTPFIVVGTFMFGALISAVAGRTELRVRGGAVDVFVGAGPIGWTRHIDPAQVDRVALGVRSWKQEGAEPKQEIHVVLRSGKMVKFGSFVPDDRRHYLFAALRHSLGGQKGGRS
jgi:hypothetical protein